MTLNKISLKFLLSKKKYSYTNISLYLSIFSFSFAISASLVVISMSRGYKVEVEKSLMSIEPDLIITQQSSNYIDPFYIDTIFSILETNKSPQLYFSRFIEEYGMIKSSTHSKGVIVYSINEDVSNFYTSIESSNINYKEDYLLLSDKLLEKLNLSINSTINLFNINKLIDDQTIKVKQIKIIDTYDTSIPSFSNNVIFLSTSLMEELFETNNQYSGVLIKGINSQIIDSIKSKTKNFPLKFISWEQKHQKTLYWLTIFSNPIYLILFFMIFLATTYQVFANWLIFHDKSKSIYRLKLLGVSNKIIKTIYHRISLNILFISLALGYLMSIVFSYIQNKYHIIELDSSIYILSQIKSITSFFDFIWIVIFTFIVIYISTNLTVRNQIFKINNAK